MIVENRRRFSRRTEPCCKNAPPAMRSRVVINEPVYIAPSANLSNCIVGPNTFVGNNAEVSGCVIRNSIISEGARVQGMLLDNSIIGTFCADREISSGSTSAGSPKSNFSEPGFLPIRPLLRNTMSYLFTSESVSEGHPDKGLRSDLRCDLGCNPAQDRMHVWRARRSQRRGLCWFGGGDYHACLHRGPGHRPTGHS